MIERVPQKGDIVNFYSTVVSFQKDYVNRNPGLVIASKKAAPTATEMSWDRGSAYVLWANGEMTKEHSNYLKVIPNE